MKVDHAGEHGAVCIYSGQIWVSRWRAPALTAKLSDFRAHEASHRTRFSAVLQRRGLRRCRSYHLCGAGGFALGALTGLIGPRAIAATTVAVERVVLRHLHEQVAALEKLDTEAAEALRELIHEEQEHNDSSFAQLPVHSWGTKVVDRVVAASTDIVIWLGMRL